MNKTKLVIISLITLIIVAAVFVFIYLRSGRNTSTNLKSYSVSVTYYNSILSGAANVNGKSIKLADKNALEQYVVVTFNVPHDIMWVLCPSGYKQSNPSSSSDRPAFDPAVGTSIDVSEGIQNNLTVTCEKNP